MEIFLFTDGASRGNPGESGGGFIAFDKEKKVLFSGKKYFGIKTNNQSEYLALIEGVKKSLEFGVKKINIFLDSELITRQIEGRYKVKNQDLKVLFKDVMDMLLKVSFSVSHVRRELNKDADKLANQAIDDF